MKLRDGFVSNSSSSSFLIRGKNLTEKQRNQIENHIYFGKKLGVEYAEDEDAWNIIHLPSGNIRVWTTMNNFDFGEFLGRSESPNGITAAKARAVTSGESRTFRPMTSPSDVLRTPKRGVSTPLF
jgi:hypothetical protein